MKLTEEIKQSILKEAKKYAGTELTDEQIEDIIGGRKLYWQEENSIVDQIEIYSNSGIPFSCFDHALHNYMNHIRSLEEGSEIELFNYEKYKYKEQ